MELGLGILRNVQAHFLRTHTPAEWRDLNETPASCRWRQATPRRSVGEGGGAEGRAPRAIFKEIFNMSKCS